MFLVKGRQCAQEMLEQVRGSQLRSLFSLFALLLTPLFHLEASSTSGTTRAVLIDGIVTTGASSGSNTLDWELDEVFEGFAASVNWYMTWDDTNLYVGRMGGSNGEASILQVHADYSGSSTSNRAKDYDFTAPEASRMGGVNFAAYLKDSYHDYYTWASGAWVLGSVPLTPIFTQQGGTAHMELAIPWDAVTGGNGKPMNIRLVLYQVVPPGNCSPVYSFLYGESPWGTGLANDGPNMGVNDGIPTSPRQPGGCGVGQDTLTRWWGCYPVIGGVGSNGWMATQPTAGPDTTLCENATAYIMQGNPPPATAVGTWSVVSQPAGSGIVNFIDPHSPTTFVQNLNGLGTYTFVWDINYGGCPSLPDTMRITRLALPPIAQTGPSLILACDQDTATITANGPGQALGQWSLVSGQGAIISPNDSITALTNLGYGVNTFEWSIVAGGSCPASAAQLTVTRYAPIYADAGPDQALCATGTTTMAALNPDLIQTSANGLWTQYNGQTSVIFTDNTLFNSSVTNLDPGDYDFIWTVSNGTCPDARDTVHLTIYSAPISDPGPNVAICSTSPYTLDANDPLSFGPAAIGVWRQLSGPSTLNFSDSTTYNATLSNLAVGTYKILWRISNGPCPPASSILTLVVTQLQHNGLDSIVRPHPNAFDGEVYVRPPLNGDPPFLYSLDGGSYQPEPIFLSLGPGTYTLSILDDNGCEDTLRFTLSPLTDPVEPPLPDPLFIPEGFSPNGDAVNDTWEILGIEAYPQAHVEIYNIWGGLVYQSTGAYTPWNGQHNGQDLQQATYYYVVDLRSPDHPVYRGAISLFR